MKKTVALTGKTGAGKSTVSDYLRKKGAYIIDGDIIAREVLQTDKNLLAELCRKFGEEILNSDKTLNRRVLAEKAFSSPEKTKLLNSVMHPVINDEIQRKTCEAFKKYDVVIVDAAAIIESGFVDKCDFLVTVHAPENVRKERIMKRDNLTEKDALIRIKGQKSDAFYLEKADFVINNFEPYSLEKQLSQLEKELFD